MKTKTAKAPINTRQAATWGRYSSDQQKDGDSKDRQDRLNRATAKRMGIDIIAEHFDPAKSVKDGATEKFKKLIATLPAHVGIICENTDRISRGHPFETMAYIMEIVKDGHFIITSNDGREYNHESIETIETMLMGSMSATLARSENNKRTKRVKEAKASAVELARQGKPAPLGSWLPRHIKYNFTTHAYDFQKDKADIYKRIFTEYSKGRGVVSITRGLNDDKIETFKGKKIGEWQRSTVFSILRYEGVIGVFNYEKERIINAWKPAITEKLFYQVQDILKTNKSKHGNYASGKVNNILRGILKCSKCGSTMTVTNHNYIFCSGLYVGKCKVGNMVRYSDMEFEFSKWFIPTAKDALLGKDDASSDIEALETKKNALTGKLEATLDLLDDDTMAQDVVKARMVKLTIERDAIDNEIATAKATSATNTTLPDTFTQLDTMIDGILDNQDIRRKVSSIIPSIVERVEIDLSDKNFPSFDATLRNGKKVSWEYKVEEFSQPIIAFGKNGTMKLGKVKVKGGYAHKE